MSGKLMVVTGATGNQGGSVVRHFLKLPGWKVRGVTRNPSSESSKKLSDAGAEMVAANLDDVDSLTKAFEGATAVFGVTDFWQFVQNPAAGGHAYAEKKGIPINYAALDLETHQAKNIATAASATPTLTRYIWSTLSDTRKWSKGKYTANLHFDGKAAIDAWIRSDLPELAEKTSYFQEGFYMSNLTVGAWAPKQQADGSYVIAFPFPEEQKGKPQPFVHPPADTGRFVEALLDAPAGKTLLGTGEEASLSDFVAAWGEANGVTCVYKAMGEEELEGVVGPLKDEFWECMQYIAEFGYDGGDPEVLRPWDMGVGRGELMGVEGFVKSVKA